VIGDYYFTPVLPARIAGKALQAGLLARSGAKAGKREGKGGTSDISDKNYKNLRNSSRERSACFKMFCTTDGGRSKRV